MGDTMQDIQEIQDKKENAAGAPQDEEKAAAGSAAEADAEKGSGKGGENAAADEKSASERLKNYGWRNLSEKERESIMDYAEGYMAFLDMAKTERESVETVKELAVSYGFRDIGTVEELRPGDKVYGVNRDKSIYLAVMGHAPLTEGFQAVGAHIDAPRLDLKQNPLYEDSGFALMKTHYYGGIKKYQWTTIPLALHGVVVLTDGTKINVNIGEDPADPVFLVTDLLPHLSAKQNIKKVAEGVPAEKLNLIVGSMPLEDAESENVKKNILSILEEKYGMKEEDFRSAEIEAVPAMKAHSLGLDRSMVAAYGQDDRVCAYPAVTALMRLEYAPRTAICILTDKEEIGSVGNTGMESRNFELFLMDLLEKERNRKPVRSSAHTVRLPGAVCGRYRGLRSYISGGHGEEQCSLHGKGHQHQEVHGGPRKVGGFRRQCGVRSLCPRRLRDGGSRLSVLRAGQGGRGRRRYHRLYPRQPGNGRPRLRSSDPFHAFSVRIGQQIRYLYGVPGI